MIQTFFDATGPEIAKHFAARTDVLDLLMSFRTTGEEWFRIELLSVFTRLPGVAIKGTNQRGRETRHRPDFTFSISGHESLVELKVLPRDRNYAYAWQRFLAGRNNKNDFKHLEDKARHGIVYVYWPDQVGWAACRGKLEAKYQVRCMREDDIKCRRGIVIISYWVSA